MQWLGVSFPRWVENELRHSADFLSRSVKLCAETLADVQHFAAEKGIPLGTNVESVLVRREELDAAVDLFHRLAKMLESRRAHLAALMSAIALGAVIAPPTTCGLIFAYSSPFSFPPFGS